MYDYSKKAVGRGFKSRPGLQPPFSRSLIPAVEKFSLWERALLARLEEMKRRFERGLMSVEELVELKDFAEERRKILEARGETVEASLMELLIILLNRVIGEFERRAFH